jgi:hypothetical protein
MLDTTSLEKRLKKMEAIWEIHKVMSKYEYYLSACMGDEITDLFARKAPGVTANIGDWGEYIGIEGIRRLFSGRISIGDMTGFMGETALTNEIIEVAEDGKTAKATWMAPGVETTRDAANNNAIRSAWCWGKYACDFIKEDGEWKLWHFNHFLTFFADYDKSWAEGGEHYTRKPDFKISMPVELAPDRPSPNRHNPYDPNGKRDLFPTFPKPYKTHEGNQDWMVPNKAK